MTTSDARIRACHCCGLAQLVPPVPPRHHARCVRCGTGLVHASRVARSNSRTAALALAALLLYPVAVGVPMLTISQLGHANETSLLAGVITLLSSGQLFVGLVVLLCSIVLPLGKLAALLVLSTGATRLTAHHRAWTYRIVEWTGRWGMLDVLLVTLLVAVLKLRDMVDVAAGPAAGAFAAVVVLSLLASASFDPHRLWEPDA